MSTESKKIGLQLTQKSASTSLTVASVFGDEEDSDDQIANEKDANKKFHMKYGSNKTRDQRAVEEALAADPDVYEYDSIHDELVSKRNAKTEEQKEADKKREPKYAHKIVLATQKRQMEKLMVDERKQAKEREAEGEEFKDKDAFVTGAYKKQIEERERIRKELEEQERMDSRLKVEDQSFWQANFNRRLLDDLTDEKPAVVKIKEEKKETIVGEVEAETEKKLFKELKPGLNQPKSSTKPKRSPTPERRRRDRDDDHQHRRRHSSSYRDQKRSSSKDRHHRRRRHDSSASQSPSPQSKENGREKHKEKPKSDKEILYERLEKIKEILKQRNSESEIFMARQRYLQRKQNGEIRAPI